MKVLIINTSESNGGAAKAANRLHKGLRKIGVESFMLVRYRQSDDPYVIAIADNPVFRIIEILRKKLDALPKIFYPSIKHIPWSLNWLPNPFLFYYIRKIKPDIINLHWINAGFVSIPQIGKICKLGIPVYWTLHDQWPLTGGCHYAGECIKYQEGGCNKCPLLKSSNSKDISFFNFQTKQKFFNNLNLICLCQWMKDCVDKSILLSQYPTHIIPNGFDNNILKPYDKVSARKQFNLPLNKKIILFGADNIAEERKGMKYLLNALELIDDNNIEIAFFGRGNFDNISKLKIHSIGYVQSQTDLAKLYSACDVFICPSLQDNLPNTVIEALLCKTPVVGFDAGGIPDMIQHKKNGYLAKYKDAKDLAQGIIWCLDNNKNGELSQFARKFAVDNFALELQANRYKEVFESGI